MNVTVDQVNLWRAAKSEHQRLEFKEAKSQYSFGKLQQYCVALANEGGGHLLLGIKDKPPREVVGSTAWPDLVKLASDLFKAVGFRVNLGEVAHPSGRVVVFEIPSRPRGTAYHLEGRYLMRSGEELVPMSEDQLRRIFAEGAPDWLEEPTVNQLSDERVVELLDVQTYFDLISRPLPASRTGILDRLEQERFIKLAPGGISISRLGAILLAKRLTDFDELRRKSPRVVVYSGTNKLDTRLDQVGEKGYAVGFQGLVGFVMSQMPQNEVLSDALRKESKLASKVVMRELIANALIHQDFSLTGMSPMVEIYSNRIEISNPGEPIVPIERFIDGYQSRNERLADCMRRFGICEEKSSGIDRVIQWAELAQLPAPDFETGFKRTVATIRGPMPFEEMGRDDRVRACYQHCVLRWVMLENMTNQSLRERFGLPEKKSANVSQIIAATQDAGFIKPDESIGKSRRLARYLPRWA